MRRVHQAASDRGARRVVQVRVLKQHEGLSESTGLQSRPSGAGQDVRGSFARWRGSQAAHDGNCLWVAQWRVVTTAAILVTAATAAAAGAAAAAAATAVPWLPARAPAG
jgi:hypothetical protein